MFEQQSNMEGESSTGCRIGDFLAFKDLVVVLEKISNADSNDKKKQLLKKYIGFIRTNFQRHHHTLDSQEAGGDSLYCVVRILLPDIDRGRRAYGFKSTSLGRMFANILGLDKTSRDGKSLIEFKDPHRAGASAGDIATVIFNVWHRRFSGDPTDQLKLSELHTILDKLSRGSDTDVNQEYQKKILQGLIRKLSALEVKWLVRVLLKSLHLGFSSTKNAVYELLHPQAKALSERVGDLEVFCQKLNDPAAETSLVDILLFNHFRPMLATRMDIIDSTYETGGSLNDSANENNKSKLGKRKPDVVSLPPPPFYIETKWDGERFQIHYDGQQLKYLSRRAFDFSAKFNETLSPKLKQRIQPGVKSFIVDGEMMAYNKNHKIFTQKGYNIDVKTMNKDNPNHCPVFVAFDLVYYNGTVLIKTPLKERRENLNRIFAVKEDVVRLSEAQLMNSKEEVIECLNSAIDDGEEGLIAKDTNSMYEPGKRGMAWLKIKPEYLEDNTVDDLDLVILGAYYTESTRRGGEITHFLVGLMDSSQGQTQYYPLARVGSGRLRSLEVKDLVKELEPRFVKTPFNNVQIRSRKKPDFMIEPAKSIVVQVKASEIIPSDVYSMNYTLRFPRITKIRRDKRPDEIMDVKEFHRIRVAGGGKLVKRTDGVGGKSHHPYFHKKRHHSDEDSDAEEGPSRIKKTATVQDEEDVEEPFPGPSKQLLSINNNKPKIIMAKSPNKFNIFGKKAGSSISITSTKKSTIPPSKNVFQSKVFCVYGNSSWKAEMESRIRKSGGGISQSPDIKDLFAIIGERRSSVLVRKAIESKKYNVLQQTWIQKCMEAGEEVPTVPLDYWGMTTDTREQFAEEYDEYGDSYTKENTLEETKALVMRIIDDEDEEEKGNRTATPSPQKVPNPPRVASNSSETDDGHCTDDDDSSTDFSESDDLMDSLFPNDDGGGEEQASPGIKWDFMSDVKIAFRGSLDLVLQEKIKFYGGKVAENENEASLTHVVCLEGADSTEDHSTAFVVTLKWLEDCLKKKKLLEERPYMANR